LASLAPLGQIEILRSRKALLITEIDDRLIAAAAKMGETRVPRKGYRMPAATGTPTYC